MRTGELEVVSTNGDGFADARAGVVEEQQQRVIPRAPRRSAVGLCKDRGDDLGLPVGDGPVPGLLRRDREDALVLRGTRDVVAQKVGDEAADRCPPAYLLGKYARRASTRHPVLRRSRISPHVLRHSCAVALLQAGVDITVIRDYLGHASIATTSRYVTSNLQMKRNVLDAFWNRAGLVRARQGPWKPKPELLRFLASL